MSRLAIVAAALLALSLSACGFHLQGSYAWPERWQAYHLDYPPRDPAIASFVALLDESLNHRGFERRAVGDDVLRIDILSLRDSKRVAAIGGDGKAVEFELLREVDFRLRGPDWRSERVQLSSTRRLSFDPSVVLAKEAEEEQLLKGLSRDLIELMMLRTEAELRRREEQKTR